MLFAACFQRFSRLTELASAQASARPEYLYLWDCLPGHARGWTLTRPAKHVLPIARCVSGHVQT
jgi:hypothetical protein